MWISKKKWEALEKRVADLERKVQSQPGSSLKIDRKSTDSKKIKQWVKEALEDAISSLPR